MTESQVSLPVVEGPPGALGGVSYGAGDELTELESEIDRAVRREHISRAIGWTLVFVGVGLLAILGVGVGARWLAPEPALATAFMAALFAAYRSLDAARESHLSALRLRLDLARFREELAARRVEIAKVEASLIRSSETLRG